MPPGRGKRWSRSFKKFPDDNKLNQAVAERTTEAADFVRTLRTAEQMEDKGQYGSSLAWYLKAQQIYPASEYASDAVGGWSSKCCPRVEPAVATVERKSVDDAD